MCMNRNAVFGLCLAIGLLVLLACAPPSTTVPTPIPSGVSVTLPHSPTPSATLPQTHTDAGGFWSIRYPAGWTVRQARSETQFRPTESSPAFLGVSLHVKARDPEAFAASVVELLRSRASDFQTIDEGPKTGDRSPGWQVGYRRTVGGEEQRGTLVCLVRYRIGYVLLGEAPASEFDAHQPDFEAMVASFHPTDFPGVVPYEQWETRRTAHLVFHYPPDSTPARDIDRIARLYNSAYDDNATYLGITLDRPIDVYLYPTRDVRRHMTARDFGFAMVTEYEVHSLWAADEQQSPGHEVVHVLTGNGWGDPSTGSGQAPAEALLGEGIAVWLDHSGRDHHRQAADLLASGKLLPIRDILGDGWFQHDGAITYPEAGSFVGFMLENLGVRKFKRIYLAKDFEAELQAAVGWTLPDLEASWHETLRKY